MALIIKDRSSKLIIVSPNMGGSTAVPLSQRIPVWLETIPPLLLALKTPHVSLVSHSAGTLYLLHTLYYLPHILSPSAPYAALLAPWVHYSHSDVKLMSAAGMLPASLIGSYWASICLTAVQLSFASAPMLGASSGVLGSVTSLFTSPTNKEKSEEERDALDKKFKENCGMGIKARGQFETVISKRGLESGIEGGSDEALLCLKKGGKDIWGVTENYEEFASEMGKSWKAFRENEEGGKTGSLKVEAYFAEDDMMSGKKGQEYFEHCFGGGRCGDSIAYESSTIEGTDHESLLHPVYGPLGKIFETIANMPRD